MSRNTVLFPATNGLWRTDGTPAGTTLVKPIGISNLTKAGGTAFFASFSHPATTDPGARLWKSDGTPEGTVLVADIGAHSVQNRGISALTPVNNSVFFVHNSDGNYTLMTGPCSSRTSTRVRVVFSLEEDPPPAPRARANEFGAFLPAVGDELGDGAVVPQ